MIGNLKFALNNLYFNSPSFLRISYKENVIQVKAFWAFIHENYSGTENIKTNLIQIHKVQEKNNAS